MKTICEVIEIHTCSGLYNDCDYYNIAAIQSGPFGSRLICEYEEGSRCKNEDAWPENQESWVGVMTVKKAIEVIESEISSLQDEDTKLNMQDVIATTAQKETLLWVLDVLRAR
jgi:hypothetical protein